MTSGRGKADAPRGHDDGTPRTAGQLGGRAARGAAAVVARGGVINIIQLISSLLLARAVSPTQYGAFAIGSTVVGFGRFLGDGGAGSAVIQEPRRDDDDGRRDLGRVLFVQLTIASFATVSLVASAPLLRSAFHAPPEATLIVAILACTLLVEVPQIVPKVRLRRQMRYERLTIIELFAVLVLYGVQIFGFLAGWSIWALVIGQVAGSITHTLVLVSFGGGLVRPRREGALALARRGLPYQGALMIQAVFAVTSIGVLGLQLNTEELGLWTWSTVLATPLVTLALSLHAVYFPSLSRLHEQHASRHVEAVGRVARLQMLFVSAAVGVLCGFAVPVIRFIYDEKWLPAVTATRISLLGVLPLMLATLLAASLESSGKARLRLRALAMSTFVGVLAAIPLSAGFGPAGAAAAVYLIVPLVDAVILLWTFRIALGRVLIDSLFVGGAAYLLALGLAAKAHSLAMMLALGAVAGLLSLAFTLVDRQALAFGWVLLRRRSVT